MHSVFFANNMLKLIKRWLVGGNTSPTWVQMRTLAATLHARFKINEGGDGFVIQGAEPNAWRLEWGPAQRAYIGGMELRLRSENRLAPELQMMLLSRHLLEKLEGETYESYTDTLKTRVDMQTPEEVRWVVLFPSLPLGTRALRLRFSTHSSSRRALEHWLDGQFTQLLECPGLAAPDDEQPLVLLTQRGRLYLRTRLESPELDSARITALIQLFEAAWRDALHCNEMMVDKGQWLASTSSVMPSQFSEPGSEP